MADLVAKVKEYCRKNRLLEKNDRIVVGVSGGADSMCLLGVLLELRQEFSLTLLVVHVNHCLRGEEADADQSYVEGFCKENQLPFLVNKVPVSAYALENGLSTEEAGRVLRYQAFEKVALDYNCSKIAVAHNKNDNAETVLFHLFRGTGLNGIVGIRPVRGKIIRPLLFATREEIEGWLARKQVGYCTDSTNLLPDYTRNKIRLNILPYVTEQINCNALDHITALAGYAQEAVEYINCQAAKEYRKVVEKKEGRIELSLKELKELDAVIVHRLILMAIKELIGLRDIERSHVISIYQLLDKQVGKEVHLPCCLCAKRGYTAIVLEILSDKAQNKETIFYQVAIPGTTQVSETGEQFSFSITTVDGKANEFMDFVPKNNYTKCYDYDKIKESVVIRTRQSKDYLIINRQGGKKTIKSLFIDAKIPKEEREKIVVIAAGNHILWVPGIRTSEGFLVTPETTKILSITYLPAAEASGNTYKI